jgi:hypothetical protein
MSPEGYLMYEAEQRAKSEAADEGISIQNLVRASVGLYNIDKPIL